MYIYIYVYIYTYIYIYIYRERTRIEFFKILQRRPKRNLGSRLLETFCSKVTRAAKDVRKIKKAFKGLGFRVQGLGLRV